MIDRRRRERTTFNELDLAEFLARLGQHALQSIVPVAELVSPALLGVHALLPRILLALLGRAVGGVRTSAQVVVVVQFVAVIGVSRSSVSTAHRRTRSE